MQITMTEIPVVRKFSSNRFFNATKQPCRQNGVEVRRRKKEPTITKTFTFLNGGFMLHDCKQQEGGKLSAQSVKLLTPQHLSWNPENIEDTPSFGSFKGNLSVSPESERDPTRSSLLWSFQTDLLPFEDHEPGRLLANCQSGEVTVMNTGVQTYEPWVWLMVWPTCPSYTSRIHAAVSLRSIRTNISRKNCHKSHPQSNHQYQIPG